MSRVKGYGADFPRRSPSGLVYEDQALVDPATVTNCEKCDGGPQYLRATTDEKPVQVSCLRCGWSVFVGTGPSPFRCENEKSP